MSYSLPVRCTRAPLTSAVLVSEIDYEVVGLDDGPGVAPGASHNGMDARDQFFLVEWLGHVVVRADAGSLDLVLDAYEAGKDLGWRLDLRKTQAAQHVKARHVRQVEVEKKDVVVVDLAEIDPFFTEIGGVDAVTLQPSFRCLLDRAARLLDVC